LGSAKDDVDPLNAFNEVISTYPIPLPPAQQTPDCAPFCNTFGGAYKKFGDKVKIGMPLGDVQRSLAFRLARSLTSRSH